MLCSMTRVHASFHGLSLALLCWLAALTLAGCNQPDPLVAIRRQQAAGDFRGSLAPLRDLLRGMIESGMDASEAADHVLAAIREDRFWIRTHPEMESGVVARCEAIAAGAPPPLMVPTDIK